MPAQTLALALQHHQVGNFPTARELCRQVLHLTPASTDALWLHGYVCQSAGDLAAALRRAEASKRGIIE